jgi:hypothetical protein
MAMGDEFGSGLRAHIERHLAPVADPVAPPAEPQPQRLEPLASPEGVDPQPQRVAPRADLDERIETLAAAEAEMAFRERRVADREAKFNVAVQRVVYELAQAIVDGELPAIPRDELAQVRARRRAGRVA